MAHIVIDRRKNDKGKSFDNRGRFVRRVKAQVRDAVKDFIKNGSIKEIISSGGKKIVIPGKGLSKPTFHHSNKGGTKDRVLPGNKQYQAGDREKRSPDGSGGARKKGTKDGTGEDSFSFSLTKDEFLELFFEDLELPDLVKNQIAKLEEFVTKRAGFSVDGPPSRLNIVRSMKLAKGRRFALRNPKKKELKQLEAQLEQLLTTDRSTLTSDEALQLDETISSVQEQIKVLRRQIRAIPFLDDVDLRYNRWEKFPNPTTQAVMFGIMDVSGSMGQWEQEMAKRFFMMMLLFLSYNYERVDIVWIRHHTVASEVSEEEFFHSHESGGTLVSPALNLMREIIEDRYPPAFWNIFGCQISDGDNYPSDTATAMSVLQNQILPLCRYFAYIEIDQGRGKSLSDLWPAYEEVKKANKRLEMAVIDHISKIYPVFRSLFEKRKP